jgi:chloramphenicol O-acetyltransferase type B
MGPFARIRNQISKYWLRRMGIKLSFGIDSIPKNGRLVLEEGTSIHAKVMKFNELSVGAKTYIRSGTELLNVREIGRFCSISNNVLIGQYKGERGHPMSWVSTYPFQLGVQAPMLRDPGIPGVRIGHDVWIGREAMIMEGVSIGTGAVVAGRSVVTRDVPEYAIVAGIPARVIRYRHPPELAARLLESRWWDIHEAELKKMPMNDPEDFLECIKKRHPARYRTCVLTKSSWHLVG